MQRKPQRIMSAIIAALCCIEAVAILYIYLSFPFSEPQQVEMSEDKAIVFQQTTAMYDEIQKISAIHRKFTTFFWLEDNKQAIVSPDEYDQKRPFAERVAYFNSEIRRIHQIFHRSMMLLLSIFATNFILSLLLFQDRFPRFSIALITLSSLLTTVPRQGEKHRSK